MQVLETGKHGGGRGIESRTKAVLSRDDIERVVSRAFSGSSISSIVEMKDGWFNRTYHIVLDAGRQHTVLKVGPPDDADVMRYEAGILQAEVGAMKLVVAKRDIPVPAIRFDDFSRTVLPFDYYFMDFVEGDTWQHRQASLTVDENNQVAVQLGKITASINSFTREHFGFYAGRNQYLCWFDAFRDMCESVFADADRFGVIIDIDQQDFFGWLVEHKDVFDKVTVAQLVHWDLWHGNVFLTRDNPPKIAGVIDFERALWGDPLMEVFLMSPQRAEHFLLGYGQDLFATRAARLRRVFYNIYLDLVMIIEDGPRQYDDKSSVTRGKQRLLQDIGMLSTQAGE